LRRRITPSQITQSCTARHVYNRRAHNDSVPVECPRGPLSMCVTPCTYVVRTVRTVFLLLYPCRYVCYTIYGLSLNYDSSTQARLSFYTSRRHTRVLYVAKIRLSTERTSCENFCRRKTRLPDNQKTTTPRLNVHSARTFSATQNATHLASSDRGPLAD